jgi:predicted  nucleic acid-binding Zn-ribbon protein
MRIDRLRTNQRLDEARQELSELLREMEILMATKERIQLRLWVLRGHQPYRTKLIGEKQRQLEQTVRQLEKCHDSTKETLVVIEKNQKELRTLRDINFNGYFNETNENSYEEM